MHLLRLAVDGGGGSDGAAFRWRGGKGGTGGRRFNGAAAADQRERRIKCQFAHSDLKSADDPVGKTSEIAVPSLGAVRCVARRSILQRVRFRFGNLGELADLGKSQIRGW